MASVREGNFDLILVSLTMSSVDGLRLCSQIRALSEGRHVPILAVSSQDQRSKLTQALEIGVNDYLTRPVDRNELVARVRTQLRKKHYSDRLRHGLQLSFEMAITDELTGLHNRRFMSHHLDSLIESSKHLNKPLTLAIMDIDLFKSVNDTHGHDIGDEVLKEVGRRVTANVRESDLACRYGGEEFVVILPDTSLAISSSIAERLRRNLETTPIEISREPGKLGITMSIGIAAFTGGDDKATDLLHRADQALYHAKHTGRNRVVADAA
jgi:two-component system cell cycle response regulator